MSNGTSLKTRGFCVLHTVAFSAVSCGDGSGFNTFSRLQLCWLKGKLRGREISVSSRYIPFLFSYH